MAQMIPKDITNLPSNTTKGEKALYRIIEKYTPDDWICYVGCRLGSGTTPDFLLIGPDLGVLVLEEKSLPMNFVRGATTEEWTIVRDSVESNETHPLRQARGYTEKAAQAMKKLGRLRNKKGKLKFVYGHGVVLSKISRHEMNQGQLGSTPLITTFEPDLVICKGELPPSTGQPRADTGFKERLVKMNKLFSFPKLDDGDIQTIRGALFPITRARSYGDEIHDRNEALEVLSIEQEQMARGKGKNDKVPHRLVRGVAGSGKSIILRVRAHEIAMENPEWNILVTFFTKSLTGYLGEGMPPNAKVVNFDKLMYDLWIDNNLDRKDFDPTNDDMWEKMLEAFDSGQIKKGIYQAILLDEAQDINEAKAKCLHALLDDETNCVYFCGDYLQNIFNFLDDKSLFDWEACGFNFKGRSGKQDLTVNYRSTKEIYEYAREFIQESIDHIKPDSISDEDNPLTLYDKIECKRLGPSPFEKKYSSEENELISVIKEIRRLIKDQQVRPGSIAILHPRAGEYSKEIIEPYIEAFNNKNIPIYWLTENSKSKSNYDQSINRVVISTPDSGKGLEWDIVFMPSMNRYDRGNPGALKFVAATRARHTLYPSFVQAY